MREEDPELSSIHRLCALPVRRGASRHQILSPMEKHLPLAKERSLLTEDSSDQSNMVENFWNEVGFPKGSRGWEFDKELEGSMSIVESR